jgi:hypothetical protein
MLSFQPFYSFHFTKTFLHNFALEYKTGENHEPDFYQLLCSEALKAAISAEYLEGQSIF